MGSCPASKNFSYLEFPTTWKLNSKHNKPVGEEYYYECLYAEEYGALLSTFWWGYPLIYMLGIQKMEIIKTYTKSLWE